MAHDRLIIRGAREHNLKNVDVQLPRNRLIVLTGLSGSGKSSLAFDTLYAEGQRRYVESLSTYARQFLGQMEKPDVDQIEGLSPAISIDQKGVSHNPRSTVGTVTEIYDHLRLLYARIGVPHCPACGQVVQRQSPDQIADAIMSLPEGARILILAPLVRGRKGSHEHVIEDIRRAGFVRARIDGQVVDTSEPVALDRYRQHTVEAVVDRLVVRHGPNGLDRTRLIDSLETALKLGNGIVMVVRLGAEASEPDWLFSEHFACPDCGISLPQIEPRSFSFNSPHGACPTCQGLGIQQQLDPDLVVANPDLSLRQGVIRPWAKSRQSDGYYAQLIASAAETLGVDLDAPWREIAAEAREAILNGTGDREIEVRYVTRHGERQRYNVRFEGVLPNLQRRYETTDSDFIRSEIERYMSVRPCPACQGGRLRPEMAAVTVAGRSIVEVSRLPIRELREWVSSLAREGLAAPEGLSSRDRLIAGQILKEIEQRLQFLVDVGLDYLSLDRRASTLAGGEAQRIRLATQIGSQLVGVLYILDEPSVGLHPRDNGRLIRTLKSLRDLGNTVVVVEHDAEMIRSADWIVDLGPGAGEHGGWVVAEGPVASIERHPGSITGQYLSGRRSIPVPARRRPGSGYLLTVHGAAANNLKSIDVAIPLGTFTVVTGVSGSGKSTLIVDVLHRRLQQTLSGSREPAGAHRHLTGHEHVGKVVHIDQSPIGRTPRSNPATYTNLFTPIRDLFAALPEARLRGYRPGRFSFNVRGGRCEACHGDGILRIEMQFLPDVYVPCEVCHGARYNRETLQIRYRDLSIAEVLNLTVTEATELFAPFPAIRRKLETLEMVGLGYIRLGQPAPTLSGGEAQRVKLSRELSRVATGDTLYILDEPTTGLHFADVEKLLAVLHALVASGNTVVVIEHNLDVIKTADWVIDLGPEGGDRGGEVVATGTPEQIAAHPTSHTGRYLARILAAGHSQPVVAVPTAAETGRPASSRRRERRSA